MMVRRGGVVAPAVLPAYVKEVGKFKRQTAGTTTAVVPITNAPAAGNLLVCSGGWTNGPPGPSRPRP
jgi:hypothetical protein